MEAKSKHIHIKYTSVREDVKETKGVQKAYYHWAIDYWSYKAITKGLLAKQYKSRWTRGAC